MSKTITIVLPDFQETVNEIPVEIFPDKWTDAKAKEYTTATFLQGLRIVLQREKSGESLAVRRKGIEEKAADIQAGTFTFGKSRGSKLTPETKGWIKFMNQLKRKVNKAAISSLNLEEAQKSLCTDWLFKTKADEVTKENATAKVEEYFGQFVTWQETNNEGLKGHIDAYKVEAAMAKVTVSAGF